MRTQEGGTPPLRGTDRGQEGLGVYATIDGSVATGTGAGSLLRFRWIVLQQFVNKAGWT
jgi:hypothetical protein